MLFWFGMQLFAILIAVFALVAPAAAADGDARYLYAPLTEHLNIADAETLAVDNQVIAVQVDATLGSRLRLPPAPLAALVEGFAAESNARIAVEGLFFVPLTAEQRARATPLEVYNITRAISTLEGIEYYSASRGRYRVFYEESFVIDSPETKVRQADPLLPPATSIPVRDTQYLQQRDSSFGENIYRARYLHGEEITRLEIINLTTMYYTILPLVQPERLRTLFAAVPTERGVLFYGVSLIRVGSLLGLEERVVNSFTNRLRAVGEWFDDQLSERVSAN